MVGVSDILLIIKPFGLCSAVVANGNKFVVQ